MTRPSWNETFMDMAVLISKRSPDPHTKVGAVIVNDLNHIVGIGYNGLPRGCDPKDYPMERPQKYDYFVHAEANAILNSITDLKGCKLFSTLSPCQECAKLIIQKGIKEVYYKDYRHYPATIKMFEDVGIKLSSYNIK